MLKRASNGILTKWNPPPRAKMPSLINKSRCGMESNWKRILCVSEHHFSKNLFTLGFERLIYFCAVFQGNWNGWKINDLVININSRKSSAVVVILAVDLNTLYSSIYTQLWRKCKSSHFSQETVSQRRTFRLCVEDWSLCVWRFLETRSCTAWSESGVSQSPVLSRWLKFKIEFLLMTLLQGPHSLSYGKGGATKHCSHPPSLMDSCSDNSVLQVMSSFSCLTVTSDSFLRASSIIYNKHI